MTQTINIKEEHLRALIEKIQELQQSGMMMSEDHPGMLNLASDMALLMIFSEGFARGRAQGEAEERERWRNVETAARRLSEAFGQFRDNMVFRMADMGLLPRGKS